MSAITSTLQPGMPNRRRRVRHKIQTPAYATFTSEPRGSMLDLHEVVDISEDGIAIQCHRPLQIDNRVDLCLDLADCPDQIMTTGYVVWANASGRAGLRFASLPPDSLSRLREWLFVNVMAGVANSEVELPTMPLAAPPETPRPSYTDTLAAVMVVQRQAEALGHDFSGALQLISDHALALLRASGVAIALADPEPEFMICRSSSGSDAPPIGSRLQVGSGFSGECVQSGKLLRCDDTELDSRVDRDSCRVLGIRSILAAPVRSGLTSIGIIEAFSANRGNFSETDERVLSKLADVVLATASRARTEENLPPIVHEDPEPFVAPPGSVLFASTDDPKENPPKQENVAAGISLPRSYLFVLAAAAGAISMALGFITAPFIQSTAVPWIQNKIRDHRQTQLQTVLASTKAPVSRPTIEAASLEQLQQMAQDGDPDAQNALGLRYAQGDGVKLNENEAVRWFTQAAEQGNVAAQSKLGSFYYSGRGVPQDPNRAYFWMVVARLNGDEASKAQAPFVRSRLTRAQVASIEQDASHWIQQHGTNPKPPAGQPKS